MGPCCVAWRRFLSDRLVGGAAVRLVLAGPQPVLPLLQAPLLRPQGRLLLSQVLPRDSQLSTNTICQDKYHLSGQIRFVLDLTCRSAASWELFSL